MQKVDFIRNKKVEDYVFISQVVFLILLGVLIMRVYQFTDISLVSLYRNWILLVIPVFCIVILKGLEKEWYQNYQVEFDNLINSLYLVMTVAALIHEEESFFKLLLLMPVVVSALQALQYGKRWSFIWATAATVGVGIVDALQQTEQLDVDLLVVGMMWLFAWLLGMVSEIEGDLRKELRKQAELDGMTGIYNHRSFYNYLEEYFAKAQQEQTSLIVLMIDVDFFKYYNDAYGHQKGDMVIKQLAVIIQNTVGDRGICARYGGDEFAVIITNCSSEEGLLIGERIRESVVKTEFHGSNILPKGHLTVSIGLACFPDNAESKERLLQMADEALYKAKYTNSEKVELYYSVFDEIGHSLQDKEKDLLNSLKTLLMVINAKDRYTYGHSERVMYYSTQIANRLALWEFEIQNLTVGALLHDVGKIEISRDILNKTGKLTNEEWHAIRQHPIWGADMIRPVSALHEAVEIILYHHENYDGSGYPYGLRSTKIPLGARILRVADSFDAITSNRPYKDAMTIRDALENMKKFRGIYYDPEVFDVFEEYIYDTGIITRGIAG